MDEEREEIKMIGFTEYFIKKLKRENVNQDYKVSLQVLDPKILFSIKIDETRWMPKQRHSS